MNGAELLVSTLAEGGVEICFANAGTTEIPLVLALDKEHRIRTILGLFEGVCSGAADGYGRLLGKPAMTLLHLGPGFANSIANLHNARRASTPLINIIGQHASWHIDADAPLTMEIEGLARSVSRWVKTASSSDELAADAERVLFEASRGRIASLIVPADIQWSPSALVPERVLNRHNESGDNQSVKDAVRLLAKSAKSAIILGREALRKEGLELAAIISDTAGCDLLAESFPGYIDRGEGFADVTRIPYFPEPARELLSQYGILVLAGAHDPVTFFGYPGTESHLISKEQKKVIIGDEKENPLPGLRLLADHLSNRQPFRKSKGNTAPLRPSGLPTGALTAEATCRILAAFVPEGAIVVDEGLTTSFPFYAMTGSSPCHSYLTIAGGSIGYGMPCATGAALACPERPVINFQADGSAMYTVQALWTQARERLNVKTVLCSNNSYAIIRTELERAGASGLGSNALSLIDIDNPQLDWVKIAGGMGVPGIRATSAEHFITILRTSLAEKGPFLIEVKL